MDKFEDDENVLAICGHRPLIDIPHSYKYNYYFAKGFFAWGFGMWREKSKLWVSNPEELKRFISNKSLRKKLKFYHEKHYYSTLNYIKQNREMYGDGVIALHLIKNNMYCVYPEIAKSRNHGHDGSGVHCGNQQYSKYANQTIDEEGIFDFSDNVPLQNKLITKNLRKYSKVSMKEKIKMIIKKILFID